jgi:hypothetical protein
MNFLPLDLANDFGLSWLTLVALRDLLGWKMWHLSTEMWHLSTTFQMCHIPNSHSKFCVTFQILIPNSEECVTFQILIPNSESRHYLLSLRPRNLCWKVGIFPGKVEKLNWCIFPGKDLWSRISIFSGKFSLFFCRSILHTTFNDQHDKEDGGRRRIQQENAAVNNNKGPQSPAQEAGP